MFIVILTTPISSIKTNNEIQTLFLDIQNTLKVNFNISTAINLRCSKYAEIIFHFIIKINNKNIEGNILHILTFHHTDTSKKGKTIVVPSFIKCFCIISQ